MTPGRAEPLDKGISAGFLWDPPTQQVFTERVAFNQPRGGTNPQKSSTTQVGLHGAGKRSAG